MMVILMFLKHPGTHLQTLRNVFSQIQHSVGMKYWRTLSSISILLTWSIACHRLDFCSVSENKVYCFNYEDKMFYSLQDLLMLFSNDRKPAVQPYLIIHRDKRQIYVVCCRFGLISVAVNNHTYMCLEAPKIDINMNVSPMQLVCDEQSNCWCSFELFPSTSLRMVSGHHVCSLFCCLQSFPLLL